MADMDTVVLRNRPSEYISCTLGPEGHELSRIEMSRMVLKAIKSIENGEGREVDLGI